jgi:lysophospholipase L1-like esterase
LHSCSRNLGGIRTHLQPPRHSRLNNGPVGQEHDKEHLAQRSLDRVRKANKPNTGAELSEIPVVFSAPATVFRCTGGGYKQLIERAHAKAIRIFGGTLTPFEGADGGFYRPEGETKRQAVNKFIRTSGAFDAVIDFDLAVRDPSHPTRLAPIYDSGDHLHPNDGGYSAMASAIDLSLFAPVETDGAP